MSDEDENESPETSASDNSALKMKPREIVAKAREICEEYREAHGLTLTVRQVYYQLVARGLLGSGQDFYKRVVGALSDARVTGEFPMHFIEDRGRDAQPGKFTLRLEDVDHAVAESEGSIGSLTNWHLRYDPWYGQKTFVSVWVEKEALAGVFQQTCEDLGVGLFACRGYPSVSSLHEWAEHAHRATCGEEFTSDKEGDAHGGTAEKTVILYFGDHDPDGLQIPRSAVETIERMQEFGTTRLAAPLELNRIALTMAQIRQYRPPPFEAKITSSRYARYVRECQTQNAWELDALDPGVLQRLIRDSVNPYFDKAIAAENTNKIRQLRGEMRERMLEDGWFAAALGEE